MIKIKNPHTLFLGTYYTGITVRTNVYMRMFVVAKTKVINNLKVCHHGTDENTTRNIMQLLKIMR